MIIRIQSLHLRKVLIPHPNNNNTQRQLTSRHNLINRRRHIMNHPISQNQQHGVSVIISLKVGLGEQPHLLQQRLEQSRTRELHLPQGRVIELEDALHTLRGAPLVVPGEREEVAGFLHPHKVGLGSEPVGGDELVVVVVEEDLADAEDGELVVVELAVEVEASDVVERGGVVWEEVGAREVDAADDVDFGPASEVVDERVVDLLLVAAEVEIASEFARGWVF